MFIAEAFLMMLLHYLPQQTFWMNAFLDATLLVALISPVFYFFLFKPLVTHNRERLEIEETLRQNEEEQFKIMIRASLDGFWITDLRGRFQEVNDAYCVLMGYSREELLKMNVTGIEAMETPKATARHISRVLDTGGDRFETRQRRKDGRILDMEISANYSPLHGGRIYCFSHDITDRKRTEDELKLSAQILSNVSDTVFLLDLDGHFIYLNEAAWKSRGYTQDEMMAMNLHELNTPEQNTQYAQRMKALTEIGQGFFESAHRCKNGTTMPVEVSARVIESGGRKVLLSVIRDITERKRTQELLSENESRLKDLFENLSSGVAVYHVSPDGQDFFISDFNRAAEHIDQVQREDLIGKNVVTVFPGITTIGLLDVFRRVWTSGVAEHFPVSFYQDDRITGWRENYVYKLPNGEIAAIYNDLTKEKQAEEQLQHLAHYDALTGLPNRTLFSDRLQQALATAKRSDAHMALLLLDLDKFKPVNDTLGHAVGDLLLIEVGKRLQACVRESDTVSRLGGDEFVVLLPTLEAEPDAMRVAEKIRNALSQPFVLADHHIGISASIGVAVYPQHGSDERTLTKNADTAMYVAKNAGNNNARLFQPDLLGW
ncbi:MAG: diguanylate cyclase [Rhodoferax sp.]|uniref:sensor domain-containing protein n=1 Tax=Rhodoferax sp. TaxID=50421 RepID=UPI0027375DF9|nr:sensor domain-containing diguanylate cyclase [Rhodoferax sp.]MDP2679083.1 diguanylate cyclase [Rhodoferax sp.]